jgi:hypothetical protein
MQRDRAVLTVVLHIFLRAISQILQDHCASLHVSRMTTV